MQVFRQSGDHCAAPALAFLFLQDAVPDIPVQINQRCIDDALSLALGRGHLRFEVREELGVAFWGQGIGGRHTTEFIHLTQRGM